LSQELKKAFDELLKARGKKDTVGTVRNGRKKVAEGKWVKLKDTNRVSTKASPKWVKPPFDEFKEELISEDEISVLGLSDSELKAIYEDSEAVLLEGKEIKKLNVSDPGFKVPSNWLDPKKNVGMVVDDSYRFDHNHHEKLIPDMLSGNEVTMPIIQRLSPGLRDLVLAGRHRVVYAHSMKAPLKVLKLPDYYNDLMDASDEDKKKIIANRSLKKAFDNLLRVG